MIQNEFDASSSPNLFSKRKDAAYLILSTPIQIHEISKDLQNGIPRSKAPSIVLLLNHWSPLDFTTLTNGRFLGGIRN